MFPHVLFTFGLFARMMSTVVPAICAIEEHESPETTTCVTRQS